MLRRAEQTTNSVNSCGREASTYGASWDFVLSVMVKDILREKGSTPFRARAHLSRKMAANTLQTGRAPPELSTMLKKSWKNYLVTGLWMHRPNVGVHRRLTINIELYMNLSNN